MHRAGEEMAIAVAHGSGRASVESGRLDAIAVGPRVLDAASRARSTTSNTSRQQRAGQTFVGIRMPVTMEGFAAAIDNGWPEVFGWLEDHGVAPAGRCSSAPS